DLEENLAFPDFLAFLESDVHDLSVDARLHRDGGIRLDVADRLNPVGNELLRDRRDGDRDRRRSLRTLTLVCADLGAEIRKQDDGDDEHADAAEHHPALRGALRREARSLGKIHGFANDLGAPRIPSATRSQPGLGHAADRSVHRPFLHAEHERLPRAAVTLPFSGRPIANVQIYGKRRSDAKRLATLSRCRTSRDAAPSTMISAGRGLEL